MSKSHYVPVAPNWLADISPETSEHGPLAVLFIEVQRDEEYVWGIDREGHLIRDLARTTTFRPWLRLPPREERESEIVE